MVKKRSQLLKVISQFKDQLSQRIDIDSLILFGSYSRGKPRPYSDVDIAVVSRDFKKNTTIKNLQFLFNIAKQVDLDLEPLAFLPEEIKNPDSRSFAAEILRSGKLIYKNGRWKI